MVNEHKPLTTHSHEQFERLDCEVATVKIELKLSRKAIQFNFRRSLKSNANSISHTGTLLSSRRPPLLLRPHWIMNDKPINMLLMIATSG